MPTLEGAWNCTQCETMGIPGRELICPLCKDPRNPLLDPEERPYLPEDAQVVTDDEGLRLAELGPNWNCGKCGNANLAGTTVCAKEECGEPLNYDDNVAGVHTYVSGVDAEGVDMVGPEQLEEDHVNLVLEDADNLRELETTPLVAPSRMLHASAIPRRGIVRKVREINYTTPVRLAGRDISRATIGIVAGAIAALVLIVGGGSLVYGAFFKTSTVELTVENLTWERQVEVEEFRTLKREDWDYPGDARIKSQYQAVHHYVQVQTGTKQVSYQEAKQVRTGSRSEQYACGSRTVDKGNGFFSTETTYCTRMVDVYSTVYETKYRDEPVYRQDPVYRTKYVYEIDRWVTDRFDTASGESDESGVEVTWPASSATGDKERKGNETREDYEVELTDTEGRSFNESLDYELWSLLSEGETVTGEQTRRGALRSVTWPVE